MLAIDLLLVKIIMALAKPLHNIFDISQSVPASVPSCQFSRKNPPPFNVSPAPALTGSAAWELALQLCYQRNLKLNMLNIEPETLDLGKRSDS